MKLLIPDIVDAPSAPDGVEMVAYDPSSPIPDLHVDAEGLVVWGVPNDLLADAATRLQRLRWVQLLSAGSDAALAAGFPDHVAITSGRSLHDAPVAEHALALTLAAARRLNLLVRAQIGHRWAGELGGIQAEPSPGVFSTLRDANVVIWGFGSIGSALAPHLRALGASVTGVGRRPRREGDIEVVTDEQLPQLFATTDVVIMILPAGDETEHALSAALLAALPPHAWVINVGRGSTIDEQALVQALRADRIGGAALDVTTEEPLPASSPLWDLPNVIITPHAAGGRPLGAAELIAANLRAYRRGEQLRNLVRAAKEV
ncbi:NAD(P)-binding domain-containing protein [Microbacterium sp. zg.Y1090]|uniref:NAD(P)-dependent oxidoreductase n=1 Tax=Microbacterium TaxID=33882 RepID=UPI00214C67E8|nr:MULTISPECIES: NAD(P)-dependent oxidoreductase [unclassified Microbacterium]MCR2812937.1 NAD(P)-binding domain-containing protein [Microbacterium sp. zg.Y1084]MCR2817254.1 NAD(P)-binding domain-containing protein [Microbacterium sp. zg.Y1090]MDL5486078.1 NAD(P)-dependent oxidoreductase [Microbacterium sp. zg-Y1211]WIM29256.1 NAD(P)-dependent oxidoreductase [Microbacterium sp. zg-Y1090]